VLPLAHSEPECASPKNQEIVLDFREGIPLVIVIVLLGLPLLCVILGRGLRVEAAQDGALL
jgi:hypothetical protein